MRVLHLIPSLVGGGAERQLALLSRALARLDLEVHVGYLHEGVNGDLLRDSGVTLHRLAALGNHDPLLLPRVIRLLRSLRLDVVQTWLTQMDVLGGLGARIAKVPVVLTERSSSAAYPRGIKSTLRLRIGRRASAVAANSESGLNYWRANGYEGCLVVIRNGLSDLAINPIDQSENGTELVVPTSERIILFAGRLNAEKNLERLIPALDKVLMECPGYTAILCGEGPQRTRIQKWIGTARMGSKIRMLGFRPDLRRWMERAAVFVSVSLFEGNPNAVLEAMAAGCPLLVSDIPEHREILDESSAIFCSPYSSDAIAAGLKSALGGNSQAFVRARVARERAAAFTIEAACAAYIDLYEAVLRDFNRKTA